MRQETNCDAVMIGRGASTNPWIFRQMEQFAAGGQYDEPSDGERYRLLSQFFRHLSDAGWPHAIGKMKQFACYFTHGISKGTELRRQVTTARSAAEIRERVDAFFSVELAAGAG